MEQTQNPPALTMRLFRLTLATIFQRKAWVICVIAVAALPFALPYLSSASERPVLVQPARVQAAWSTLWICALVWGLFTASREGDSNAKSGIGEHFESTGLTKTHQLLQIWLACFSYIIPLAIIVTLVCQFAAQPSLPQEKEMWLTLNFQYLTLFLLVIAPLQLLATSLSSRFGATSGFCATLLLAFYGLFGVSYLDSMLKVEENPIIQGLLYFSPQYRYADLTQRMYYKSGALTGDTFTLTAFYFLGLALICLGISRLIFRSKSS